MTFLKNLQFIEFGLRTD